MARSKPRVVWGVWFPKFREMSRTLHTSKANADQYGAVLGGESVCFILAPTPKPRKGRARKR